MAKATWNGTTIAESDRYILCEGSVYFPSKTVHDEYLRLGSRQYTCPWKGEAAYYDIVLGERVNENAAWSYPEPRPAAAQIRGYVAFDLAKGVAVER